MSGGRSPASRRTPKGTLAALIEKYRREVMAGTRENGAPLLASTTRKTYGTALKRLEIWAGKHPLAFITRARVKVLKRDDARDRLGHHAAHATLKMGRVLFAFAATAT
jgi:hypothetical protein